MKYLLTPSLWKTAFAGVLLGALSMGHGHEVFLGLSPLSLVAFAIAFSSTAFFFFSMLRGR
jgi:hypothetical protein